MAGRTLVSKFLPFVGAATRTPTLIRLRPLIAAGDGVLRRSPAASFRVSAVRSYSSRPTTSSLNDPSPNWSNRPPKETILLDGCDFEHWLVVMEPPEPNLTRDDIIDSYIKTLAQVVGSEQEARMSIYSVSTKHYFAFGAKVSEELSYKIKALPKVRWVLPDSYLDVKNKDYGGEPFIDGQAVPYDPKYHEEWVRNNARANERSRRNDRPRNFDRSRNFERRRETMQYRDAPPMANQGFQSGPAPPPPPHNAAPPMANQGFQSGPTPPPPQNTAPPMMNQGFQSGPTPPPPQNAAPPSQPPPNAGYQGFQSGPTPLPPQNAAPPSQPPPNAGYQTMPNPSYQGGGQGYQGQAYQGQGYQQGPQGYQQGPGSPSYQQGPGNPGYQQSGGPPFQGNNNYQTRTNTGYQGNPSNYQSGSYQGNPSNYQSGSYQGKPTDYQPGNGPTYPGRDVAGRD